jgi:hypothetical protein
MLKNKLDKIEDDILHVPCISFISQDIFVIEIAKTAVSIIYRFVQSSLE